jgi:hypothetical protein
VFIVSGVRAKTYHEVGAFIYQPASQWVGALNQIYEALTSKTSRPVGIEIKMEGTSK